MNIVFDCIPRAGVLAKATLRGGDVRILQIRH
jgi:hypothetical protein